MQDDNRTVIDISTGTLIRTVVVVLFFGALYLLRDVVLALLTAVVIASSIEPLTKWFIRYNIPRTIAVIIIYLSLAISFAGILFFFLPPLIDDFSGVFSKVPEYVDNLTGKPGTGNDILDSNSLIGGLSEALQIRDNITEFRTALSDVSGGVLRVVQIIFGGLLSFVLIVVFSFYLSVQERGVENFLRLITPFRRQRYVVSLWQRVQVKVGRWMQGQLLLGLLIGVLVFLGLTILGLGEYAFLLAVLAAMFELIPFFGPVLAAIPAVGLGFLESVSLGFMVLGFYIIIQQFENHLFQPLVVRKVIGIPPLVAILALVIGGKLLGFLGLILGVPAAVLLMEYAYDREKDRVKEDDEKLKS